MHGRVHPNYCHVTDLLVVDLRLSLAYFMMTHPLPVASKLPIEKKLWLPRNYQHTTYSHINSSVHHKIYNIILLCAPTKEMTISNSDHLRHNR